MELLTILTRSSVVLCLQKCRTRLNFHRPQSLPKNIFLSLFLTSLISSYALALQFTPLAQSSEDFKYDHYYQFYDLQQADQDIQLSAIQDIEKKPRTPKSYQLLRWNDVGEQFPLPAVKYNRAKQFGPWKHPDTSSCLDTRGLVLARDSKSSVQTNQNCTVTQGDWYDPYTDTHYNKASDLQIDHVVALKNAYMTGAFEWSDHKRCLYANYMGNSYHLLAVLGKENSKKGDMTPQEYLPPIKTFTCDYLKIWLKIKFIWNLRITPAEGDAIQKEVKENHCDENEFIMTEDEYQNQQQFITEHINFCTP